MNTVHQVLTEAMFAKAICRKCGGHFDAVGHTFAECEAHQIDMATLADKQQNGYLQRQIAAGMKAQINDKTGAFA